MPPAVGAAAIMGGTSLAGSLMNNHAQKKAQKQAGQGIAYDPTNPILRPLIGQQASALQGLFNGQQNPFGNLTSPLQQQTGGAISQYLNQMSPEMRGQGVNPGQQVIDAARPQFDRNLMQANTQLANSIPGRFSSAFAGQSNDLNAKALQDFNMFQAQALQQGQQMQQQQRDGFQNFLLGAQGAGQAQTNNLFSLLGQSLGWSQPSDMNVVMGGQSISGLPGAGGYGAQPGMSPSWNRQPSNMQMLGGGNPLMSITKKPGRSL